MISQLDVPLVRIPSESSMELTEPIILCNKRHGLLSYELCILGKSFRVGSRIPIKVKLTPIVNIQCRWIRVSISQHLQYWTTGSRPRHLQPLPRKMLLFEKHAAHANQGTYPGSKMRIITDHGIVRSCNNLTANLLGQVSETSEIDLEVQLPRCSEVEANDRIHWLQPSTTGSSLNVSHWIRVRRRKLCCDVKAGACAA